jgi:hypothetical protein
MRNIQFVFSKKLLFVVFAVLCGCATAISVAAQTTAFTYQGKLNDAGVAQPTNGTYDFLFRLYDAGGAQLPNAQRSVTNVAVVNGIFTVQLDFGSLLISPATNLYLDIAVRPSPPPNTPASLYQTLSPRQPITSAPFAGQALNSTLFGGFPVSQFVQTTDARLSDDRNPLPGSANYIQNQTGAAQASTNFNIGGTGSANVLNAATQFNLGGNRIIGIPGAENLFVGIGAGMNSLGAWNTFIGTNAGKNSAATVANTFVGRNAGFSNTIGNLNTFVGSSAGYSNTTGVDNSFFGVIAGYSNTTGSDNSFFGKESGYFNSTGSDNTFVGTFSGYNNTFGNKNSFFGKDAGFNNTTGTSNTFFGWSAGAANTLGNGNVFIGANAGFSNTSAGGNAFVGANAGMTNTAGFSNSFFGGDAGRNNMSGSKNAFFGTSAGFNNTTGINNVFFGNQAGFSNTTANSNTFVGSDAGKSNSTGATNTFIGTFAGQDNTMGDSNVFVGTLAGSANTTGNGNVFVGKFAGNNNGDGDNNTLVGFGANTYTSGLTNAAAIGAGAIVRSSDTIVLGRERTNGFINDVVVIHGSSFRTNGADHLCINDFDELLRCNGLGLTFNESNAARTNVAPFASGLDLVKQLRPISFDLPGVETRSVGFAADEVAKINPLLVNYNQKGEAEGVKYERLSTVFVNAFKDQQEQIATQQKRIEQQQQQIEAQQKQIDELKMIVCSIKPDAIVCQK